MRGSHGGAVAPPGRAGLRTGVLLGYASSSRLPTDDLKRLRRVANKSPDQAQQAKRRGHQRNKAVKSSLRTSSVTSARPRTGAWTRPGTAMRTACRQLDKAASKGVIRKSQAADRKSAITKRYAELTQLAESRVGHLGPVQRSSSERSQLRVLAGPAGDDPADGTFQRVGGAGQLPLICASASATACSARATPSVPPRNCCRTRSIFHGGAPTSAARAALLAPRGAAPTRPSRRTPWASALEIRTGDRRWPAPTGAARSPGRAAPRRPGPPP